MYEPRQRATFRIPVKSVAFKSFDSRRHRASAVAPLVELYITYTTILRQIERCPADQKTTAPQYMSNKAIRDGKYLARHMPVLGNVHPIKIENFDIFWWRHFSARSSCYIINRYGYPRGSLSKILKEIVSFWDTPLNCYMLNVAHATNDVKWRPIVTTFGTLIENMSRTGMYDCHIF